MLSLLAVRNKISGDLLVSYIIIPPKISVFRVGVSVLSLSVVLGITTRFNAFLNCFQHFYLLFVFVERSTAFCEKNMKLEMDFLIISRSRAASQF